MTNAGDLFYRGKVEPQMRECGSCKLSTVDTTGNSVHYGQNGLQRNAPCAALNLDASLYTCLQILSVSLFEKTQISCAFQPYCSGQGHYFLRNV